MSVNERLNEQMIGFSRVAERSIPIARQLLGKGLCLLGAQYGGLVGDHGDHGECLDPVLEMVETELLKERYGSWSVGQGGQSCTYGYHSTYLDALLTQAGVTREQLEMLGRSPEVDRLIEQQPWAKNYRRDFLVHHRSSEQVRMRKKEQDRECRELGLVAPDSTDLVEHVRSALRTELHKLGYEVVSRPYHGLGEIFTNQHRVDGVAIEFALDVRGVPIAGLPIISKLMMMPVLEVSSCDERLRQQFMRGEFFKLAESYVPNFGCYRVAWTVEGMELLVHAYRLFLDAVTPELEKVCSEIGR
ncbi:hypothetical protein [Lysobacter arvi]|uniref:Uncharacterized protein n=1 Tax=Lysobacter arvi TaxID=3038776 RepID=A0ABU1CF51_9GAMM|nr:hypothetical protein [Lysobacter arvi]MDR0183576.1 hypothetical protein [Lysobacter arvi]